MGQKLDELGHFLLAASSAPSHSSARRRTRTFPIILSMFTSHKLCRSARSIQTLQQWPNTSFKSLYEPRRSLWTGTVPLHSLSVPQLPGLLLHSRSTFAEGKEPESFRFVALAPTEPTLLVLLRAVPLSECPSSTRHSALGHKRQ